MNSPGGYIYVLYGEDSFGRDEAVQTLKERMRALPAGDHNLSELGPETTVATLRLAADTVPFLAERRMVIVRGLLGSLGCWVAHHQQQIHGQPHQLSRQRGQTLIVALGRAELKDNILALDVAEFAQRLPHALGRHGASAH